MKKQSGFTLVEISIVVAIAMFSLLGMSEVNRNIAIEKANAEADELLIIQSGIQSRYANQLDFAGANFASVANNNFIPANRIVAGAGVNRWGGSINLVTTTMATANDTVDLTYTQVPSFECTQYIPSVERKFYMITINGVIVKSVGSPINLNSVGTACNSSQTATIVYRLIHDKYHY